MIYFDGAVAKHTNSNLDLINKMNDLKVKVKNLFATHENPSDVINSFMYDTNRANIPDRDNYFESLVVKELFKHSDTTVKEILKARYDFLELHDKDGLKAYMRDAIKHGAYCDYELYDVLEMMENFVIQYPNFEEILNDIMFTFVIRCIDITILRVQVREKEAQYKKHKTEYEYYQKQLQN